MPSCQLFSLFIASLTFSPAWADFATYHEKEQAPVQAPAPQNQQQPGAPMMIQNQMRQRLDQVQQQQRQQQQRQDGQPLNSADADNADLDELMAAQKKMMDQYGALNAVNPMSADSASGRLGATSEAAGGPQILGQMNELMKNERVAKFVQSIGKNATDPAFTKASTEIMKNPHVKWMYAGLLAYTIIYWLLKRRVLAATDRFFPKMVLRGALFVVFFMGYFLVSYGVLGPPLLTIMGVFIAAVKAAIA